MPMIERTYVMLKPDAVQRGLMGEIVQRLESKGLKPIAMKLMRIPKELAERHYGEHKGKSFFPGLIDYITSGPVLCMVWEGENAVASVRSLMGKTNPQEAAVGTIRGDLAQQKQHAVMKFRVRQNENQAFQVLLLGEGDAVHVRHHEVGDHQLDVLGLEDLQRPLRHLRAPLALELHHLGGELAVADPGPRGRQHGDRPAVAEIAVHEDLAGDVSDEGAGHGAGPLRLEGAAR